MRSIQTRTALGAASILALLSACSAGESENQANVVINDPVAMENMAGMTDISDNVATAEIIDEAPQRPAAQEQKEADKPAPVPAPSARVKVEAPRVTANVAKAAPKAEPKKAAEEAETTTTCTDEHREMGHC